MAHRYNLNSVSCISNEKAVFFDANILIYLFWSTGRKQQYLESNYSQIYSDLLQKDISMYINYIVISEVINRVLRIGYQEYLHKNNILSKDLGFKKFRNSEAGIKYQNDISIIVKDLILEQFSVVNDSFTKDDIVSLLEDNKLDFSDKAILTTCISNSYILVTHDSDYKDSDIEILSCNQKITNN